MLLLIALAVVAIPLGLDLYMPVPENNPLTVEKIARGRELFFDIRLSRDRTISCASCHDPQRAFTDGRPVPVGVFNRLGRRSAPTLINRGYGRSFFWDGRAASLEQQVLQPIQDPNEMDMTLGEVSARVGLTIDELSQSLASFIRSLVSGDSPFDRYVNGARDVLSTEQQAGLQIFRGKGNCTACHVGPTFTDERFHNTGVAWQDGRLLDEGRSGLTGKVEDRGAFKTPTLREIARTAPYMHNGSIATLEEVVDFYDRGGNANPALDPELRPLRLTPSEKRAVVAFLQALNGSVGVGDIEVHPLLPYSQRRAAFAAGTLPVYGGLSAGVTGYSSDGRQRFQLFADKTEGSPSFRRTRTGGKCTSRSRVPPPTA